MVIYVCKQTVQTVVSSNSPLKIAVLASLNNDIPQLGEYVPSCLDYIRNQNKDFGINIEYQLFDFNDDLDTFKSIITSQLEQGVRFFIHVGTSAEVKEWIDMTSSYDIESPTCPIMICTNSTSIIPNKRLNTIRITPNEKSQIFGFQQYLYNINSKWPDFPVGIIYPDNLFGNGVYEELSKIAENKFTLVPHKLQSNDPSYQQKISEIRASKYKYIIIINQFDTYITVDLDQDETEMFFVYNTSSYKVPSDAIQRKIIFYTFYGMIPVTGKTFDLIKLFKERYGRVPGTDDFRFLDAVSSLSYLNIQNLKPSDIIKQITGYGPYSGSIEFYNGDRSNQNFAAVSLEIESDISTYDKVRAISKLNPYNPII